MKPWLHYSRAREEFGQFLDLEARGKRKMPEKSWVQGKNQKAQRLMA
jgi:hypothetical protein